MPFRVYLQNSQNVLGTQELQKLFKTFLVDFGTFCNVTTSSTVLHDNYIGPLKGRRHPLQQTAYLRNLIEFWMLANYVGCHLLR